MLSSEVAHLGQRHSGAGLLAGKIAVVYGAAGGAGRVVALAFAREGAAVILAGRTSSTLKLVAEEISKAGGTADVAEVDALNPESVENHLRKVLAKFGRLDVSFNLISTSVAMGMPLTELTREQFMKSSFTLVQSHFVTATAAIRHMAKQGGGVVLALTTASAQIPIQNVGGFAIACASIEALCRQLAVEAGPRGVRVVSLRTGGTPDNPVLQEVYSELAKVRGTTKEEVERAEAEGTALKRLPLLKEVANAAVILASDYASAITATTADASCGDMVD